MPVIKLFQNERSPSLSDTIQVNAQPFNLTGCSVAFFMRANGTSTLTVNNQPAVIVNAIGGQVRYDWGASDTVTTGEYRGWWRVTLVSGLTQDTDEFPLEIVPHGPQTTLSLCDLQDVKVLMESQGNQRDGLIMQLIPIASAAIQKELQREFVTTVTNPATRTFRWDAGTTTGRVLELAPFDIQSIT